MKQKHKTIIEGHNFIHKTLWRVVEEQMEDARRKEKGSYHNNLVAMTFAFMAAEAYINYVGEHIDCEWPTNYAEERGYNKKHLIDNAKDKFEHIIELCCCDSLDFNRRPLKTVMELVKFRNSVAHGRMERITKTIVHNEDQEPDMFIMPFNNIVSKKNAERAFEDVKKFADTLNEAALKKVSEIAKKAISARMYEFSRKASSLSRHALDGLSGYSTSSTKLLSE